MSDRFWKAALAVGGLGTVGAFVFWSLYKNWLTLPIFAKLSQEQTFVTMLAFLAFTFLALIYLGFLHLTKDAKAKPHITDHAFQLHNAWNGVNDLDCDQLIGPDVSNAARAMTITASSWLKGLVEKNIIYDNHFEDFETLYKELTTCDKLVPGFERRQLKCGDFVSAEMHKAYQEMVNFKPRR